MPYHTHPNHSQIERCLDALTIANTLIEREIISLTLYNELKTFMQERVDQLHFLLGRSWEEVDKTLAEKKLSHLR